jgi:hypothetical protein
VPSFPGRSPRIRRPGNRRGGRWCCTAIFSATAGMLLWSVRMRRISRWWKTAFLDLRSEQGEPAFADGMLEVVTETSGRKAWWSGTTYFRWQDGQPVAVATWVDDCRDAELPRWVAIRHDGKGKDRCFQIERDGTGWVAREGHWEGGAEVAEAVPFATVRFRHAGEPDDGDFLAELMVMFELTTAVPANVRVLPPGNREGFDFHQQTAGLTFEIAGREDARSLLKRVEREH